MRLASILIALAVPSAVPAATITGSVIGEGTRAIAGATVEVVGTACATTSAADGTFTLSCDATGPHVVRAALGDLRPWQIDDLELGPNREFHLNFMLLPATAPALASATMEPEPERFWTRRLPNPELTTWHGRPVTLRMAAIAVAPVAFLLGALTMLALGRRLGVATRSLSAHEVGDLAFNPTTTVGPRLVPIATVGARGAEATVSFGADEIAAALADRRYGLVLASLVVAPGLFALFALALAVAMLVGQETWLFCAMLLVPAGFVVTPVMIGIQARRAARNATLTESCSVTPSGPGSGCSDPPDRARS